jgi:DegV family protein with EDD domain
MGKIAISCDSTCSITRKEAEELGIFILPLNVIVDEVEYHDGIDINNQTLAKMMRKGAKIKTSTPTYGELEAFFNNIFEKGYEKIVHICISSKLTSIFNMTTQFCNEQYGDKVTVIDSLSACSFMGNAVRYAKFLEEKGEDVETIKAKVEERRCTEETVFIPDTLTYLKRGGRISPAIATIGNMIGIKPLLFLKNGAIEKGDKMVRVVKKACIDELHRFFKDPKYNPDDYEVHVLGFDCEELSNFMFEEAVDIMKGYLVQRAPVAINVCGHTGPGTIVIGMASRARE